jgi:hypothetical protein
LSELWNKIEKSNKQKPLQRHSRLIQFAAVAASLAILFAFHIPSGANKAITAVL